MPVMDGYEATRLIRAAHGGRDAKIIILSASSAGDVSGEVMRTGADDYLPKPFRETELFEKIRVHLGAEYVYEEMEKPAQAAPAGPVTPGLFAGLPPELVARVREAAVSGDFDGLAQLSAEIGALSPGAGGALRALAGRFDSKGILELLKKDGGSGGK
jgi:hypothetical protein